MLNEMIGRAIAWLALLMAWTQLVILGLLFVFDFGTVWMQESVLYMNGALFMLALGWTLKHDAHVRVDIFYRDMPPRRQAWVNLIGMGCLLMPLCAVMLWASLPYALYAWQNLEGSRETGGLPALFLLKTIIPISALLLAVQAVAEAARAVKTIQTA